MIEESSSASSMIPQIGHFGKYHITISLTKLQPVSDTACWKKDKFDQLTSTIYGLLKLNSVTNLINLSTREYPIKTFIAQQEATKVMHKVWHCVFDVNHLQAIAFINTSGNTVNFKSDKLNHRPGGLTFFRLTCEIDSVYINPCICQKIRLSVLPPIFPTPVKCHHQGCQDPQIFP